MCLISPKQGLEHLRFLVSEGANWFTPDESLDWTSCARGRVRSCQPLKLGMSTERGNGGLSKSDQHHQKLIVKHSTISVKTMSYITRHLNRNFLYPPGAFNLHSTIKCLVIQAHKWVHVSAFAANASFPFISYYVSLTRGPILLRKSWYDERLIASYQIHFSLK